MGALAGHYADIVVVTDEEPYTEDPSEIIKQVAESEKYDVILQEAVYMNPKHDITDRVLKAMNSAK